MKKFFFLWCALMLAGVFTAGCVYVAFQQTQRKSADVPAAMAAQQAVYELQSGATPQQALPAATDMTSTITPFVIIFDESKQLVASSDGMAFAYPQGCFTKIDKSGENRVTWQPAAGLRFATVGIRYDGGYVIGAYSLSESERATADFTVTLAIGCTLYAIGCAALLLVYSWISGRMKKQSLRRLPE